MSGCVISPLLRTRDIRICRLINIFLPIHIMTSGLQMSLSSLFDKPDHCSLSCRDSSDNHTCDNAHAMRNGSVHGKSRFFWWKLLTSATLSESTCWTACFSLGAILILIDTAASDWEAVILRHSHMAFLCITDQAFRLRRRCHSNCWSKNDLKLWFVLWGPTLLLPRTNIVRNYRE